MKTKVMSYRMKHFYEQKMLKDYEGFKNFIDQKLEEEYGPHYKHIVEVRDESGDSEIFGFEKKKDMQSFLEELKKMAKQDPTIDYLVGKEK